MTRRPPRSTLSSSSAASDVYKRQGKEHQVQPRHVLRVLGCLGQGSVDFESYMRLLSTLHYEAASSTHREANPSLPGSPSESNPPPDPHTMSAEELKEIFGIHTETSSGSAVAAGQDDTETAIARDVVAVVQASSMEQGDTLQKEKKGMRLYLMEPRAQNQKDKPSGIKIQTTVDLPAKLLFRIMSDPDLQATGGTGANNYKTIATLDDCEAGSMRLAHSKVSIPLFADQDFALGEFTGFFHDSYVYGFSSVKDRRIPAAQGRCVRGVILMGGWSFYPVSEGKTRISFVSYINPNRTVPKALVGQGHDKSAKAVITFLKNCRAHIKKHGINPKDFY
eukprot:TRINITY_DN10658_c0_g1_i1.p1 TRINITY_DN10658_c0_g1~~TRINITY_DN10658_c0_g1_i1.p1  ORF type:complete len:336 (+),score=109.50 TRINITY_DN10658_c0_g1_i1:86-1093(+)